MALFRGPPLAVSRRRVIIKSPLTEGVRPLLSGGAYNFARWRLNNRKSFSRNVLRDAPALAPPRRNSSRRRFLFQGCRICFSGCPLRLSNAAVKGFLFLDASPSSRADPIAPLRERPKRLNDFNDSPERSVYHRRFGPLSLKKRRKRGKISVGGA